MHIFFATNNLGGGGTNVSRFLLHLDKIKTKHIGILLNYYYLSLQSKPAFDTVVLKKIFEYSDIRDFIRFVKSIFIENKRQPNHVITELSDLIKYYILDSGTGNILRDLISKNNINKDSLSNLVELYLHFSERLNFNFVVAFDYALKYTHKKGEGENKRYQMLSNDFTKNEKANLEILRTTIQVIKTNKHKQNIIAPLHGYNLKRFENYLDFVLKLEQIENYKFHGFGLGGIADTKKLPSDLWNVPDYFNQKMKSLWIVSQLTKNVAAKIDNRKLHILGAGGISLIPLITYFGATSSDCHSAWRRANDGDQSGENESKMLLPLVNSRLQFIDNINSWEYIKLSNIKNLDCDCPICQEYDLKDIKKMYTSGNNENFYFAKILIFIHALYQYDYVISYCESNKNFLKEFSNSPNKELNLLYKSVLENIK
jgi:queuine/archaeosine tRNA-ribosyltransferase